MRRILMASAVILGTAGSAFSIPEGNWPPEAKGLGLPEPDWVLVIPAKREPNGAIKVWDREDPWSREWVVPQTTPSGMRTVAIAGDSEDKRTITASELDNMDVNALGRIARKYSAPALAIVVEDHEGQSAVAAWMPEYQAVWEEVGSTNGKRAAVLQVIGEIFSGYSEASSEIEGYSDVDVVITGQRFNGISYDYRLELVNEEAEVIIEATPDLDIVEHLYGNPRSVVVRGTDGRDIETILRSSGIRF